MFVFPRISYKYEDEREATSETDSLVVPRKYTTRVAALPPATLSLLLL